MLGSWVWFPASAIPQQRGGRYCRLRRKPGPGAGVGEREVLAKSMKPQDKAIPHIASAYPGGAHSSPCGTALHHLRALLLPPPVGQRGPTGGPKTVPLAGFFPMASRCPAPTGVFLLFGGALSSSQPSTLPTAQGSGPSTSHSASQEHAWAPHGWLVPHSRCQGTLTSNSRKRSTA